MAAREDTTQQMVSYVYGIAPADVEPDPKAGGVGDPPSSVTTVRHGDIAALVSEIAVDQPLGTPEDLNAHAQLLDSAAATHPVLPMRFGAVLTGPDAVADELLAAHHDEFAEALDELEGRAEYVVKCRYVEEAILAEVLAENPEAAQLREAIRGKSEDAGRDDRIALGELINNSIAAKREEDTRKVVDALNELGFDVNLREPTHEEDAAHVACLAETAKQGELENAISRLASVWSGRVNVRLLGPLAPYDFVVAKQPEE